ncbi:MAG: hypothetical protein DWQ10_04965 [Calditrichaeota bacterium]|nr:MAG: hypothetical protein DWQ10_04965 [Calditrichota bacterium]
MSQSNFMIVVILASVLCCGTLTGKNSMSVKNYGGRFLQEMVTPKEDESAKPGREQSLRTPDVDWSPLFNLFRNIIISYLLGWFSARISLQYRKPIALILFSHALFLVLLFYLGLVKPGMGGNEFSVIFDWIKRGFMAVGLIESVSFLIGSWMSALRFLSRQRIIVQ